MSEVKGVPSLHEGSEEADSAAARSQPLRQGTQASAVPLRQWIARMARERGNHPFVESIDDDLTISFAELETATMALSGWLEARGIGANDRVAILSENCAEHLITYLGVMAHGATACTVNVETNAPRLGAVLTALAPRLVVYAPEIGVDTAVRDTGYESLRLGGWRAPAAGTLMAMLHDADAVDAWQRPSDTDDDAVIFFTSGTTAEAKGVPMTFAMLLENAEATAVAFGLTAEDRILDYRSFNWASAQILSVLAPLSVGATLVLAHRFSQTRFFDWIRDRRVTVAAGNPTVINMLLNRSQPADARELTTLRYMTSSSAPLLVEQWRRFEETFGVTVAQGYGSSETGWIAGSNESSRRYGSVGQPYAYHRLAIVDIDGRALPPGEIGMIQVGADPAVRYRHLAQDGAMVADGKGSTLTGDLGYLDADGYLYVTGRQKDLIIRGGVNIAPAEIERVLAAHPGVAQAVAVGVPDAIYGEEVVAFVVLRADENIAAEELVAHCRGLPQSKRPKTVILRDDLPKTARGKLDREALLAVWQQSAARPHPA